MDSLAKISRITVLSAFVMLIIVAFVKFKIDQIPDTPEITFNHDYDEIAKIGILNVALEENATEYCIYNATPRGFHHASAASALSLTDTIPSKDTLQIFPLS